MKRMKFGNSTEPDEPIGKPFNYYGMSRQMWESLTTDQREIHYHRQLKCDHAYEYPGIAGDKTDDRLREAYSTDPYFHTAHMEPCQRWGIPPPERWQIPCECQMCLGKIGLDRDTDTRAVDVEKLRQKLNLTRERTLK